MNGQMTMSQSADLHPPSGYGVDHHSLLPSSPSEDVREETNIPRIPSPSSSTRDLALVILLSIMLM
jgi:hypothetical protein